MGIDLSSKMAFPIESINEEDLKWFLVTMMRIRKFEEEVGELVSEKKVLTPCHLYIGQEAIAAGVCYALRKDDYVFGNHRSHGHYIAKGGDLRAAMAEICCRATGCSQGRGGSMHLVAPEVGILGTSSIVAGSLPIGVGTALAEAIRHSDKVTVIFHGDGVPEEGIWHESVNFAALRHLPVIFVCENNLYSTHMHWKKRRVYDNIPEIAKEHGLETYLVDGNNVLEIYSKTQDAIENARQGKGPSLIECRTYRWRGHVGPNYDIDKGLRTQEELDAWMAYCPIKNYAEYLIINRVLSEEQVQRIQENVNQEIADAISYALASPYPDIQDLTKYVFKGR